MRLLVKSLGLFSFVLSPAVLANSVMLPVFLESHDKPSPFYIGGYWGKASFDIDSNLTTLNNDSNTNLNKSSTALKILTGIKFNDFFSLEAGYASFGEIYIQGSTATSRREQINYLVGSDMNGLFLDMLVSIPMSDRFSFYGKLGSLSSKSDRYYQSYYNENDSWIEEYFDENHEFSLFYGLGASLTLSHFVLRAEWEQLNHKHGNIDVFSLGVMYHF
jgi:OOP family OmpA-OmpF porin